MKKKLNKLLKKINFKNIIKEVSIYLKTNILTISFLLSNLLNGILIRYFTVKNFFNFKPILGDLVFLLGIIAFCYLLKPKHQFKYYIIWSVLLVSICIINSVYYSNYISFVSVSLLKTSSQLGDYADAVTNIISLKDFLFLWQPIFLFLVHKNLMKNKYYDKVKKIEVGKVRLLITAVLCFVFGVIFTSTLSTKDISRFNKQWDRRYTVMEFGVYIYQANDIVSSLKYSFSGLFESESSYNYFLNYFDNSNGKIKNNKYSNIFLDKNVIVIHAESIQNFTMNLAFNGKELTPNLNKLAREGIYFSNFYSQESIGNSSDSEFTLLTSLLPVSNGTVFVNYFDRTYNSITDLLRQKDYYTFSMHANVGSAWNRNKAYKSLGYDKFYAYDSYYNIDEVLGLGLSDKSFFNQSADIIEKIASENDKFYGTLIMLTNHTPFDSLVDSEYNDDYLVDLMYEDNYINYLENTKMGNYLKSVNYADSAIGEFINKLDEKGLLDDTIIVIYGDHDSKINKNGFEKLYYSEYIDDVLINKNDKMTVIDDYTYEINRKVPFIIWSKDSIGSEYNQQIDKVMGMIDVMPTLGNMLGVHNNFAVGNDIFNIDDNIVVFPDGSFITDTIYYDNALEEYRQIDLNSSIGIETLINYQQYSDEVLKLSNDIIIYDLIKKYNNDYLVE